ncbi:glycoside hydrolase family 31 protein [Dysgonomonas massiliensis]|uniref:glycoside hydrolase family 31 protein n=1 Tax=Dysgonomonas massiliensis TaxID=2040292 RepID=UPI000C764D02|nr:TIM-barrel domain-containing protein [Dysgonomonas massiliensis]
MKKLSLILLLFITVSLFIQLIAQTYEKTETGIKTNINSINIEVQFFNPTTVRIIKYPLKNSYKKESLAVIAQPENSALSISEKGTYLRIKSNKIEVAINQKSGQVLFSNSYGKSLLKEAENGIAFTDFDDAGVKTYKIKQSFTLDKEEAIYGLGILQNGKMSQRNQTKYLIQGNVEDVVPFIQSIKGYGLYWDNYSPTTFTDNQDITSFESEVGDCIDYYFMYGENADGVVAQMRSLTGQVPMVPLWTYGFWQSRERYKSQEELLEVVNRYRKSGVPLDGIIQDWQYWGNNYLWNAMDFLNPDFNNPKQMIDKVHEQNAHIMISIWSSFGPMTKPYRELDANNMLFNFKTWPESGLADRWPPDMNYPSGVRVYDAYNPKARDIYWKYMNEGLFTLGMDGWWMDSTEPDHYNWKPEDFDTQTHLGSFRKVRNAYPLMAVGGVYNNQRATTSDKRVFILTRSFFAGQQRYGANVWSGDVSSSWESLRNQVPAGLNFTLTGNPNFNSDIGGFFAGHYNNTWNDGSATKNPSYQELYVRWLQQGVFNTMMRSHGTDLKREIYYFGEKGEPVYDAIENAINLRYSLLPYIYSTAWDVTHRQSSFMRALVMDFSNDKKVWDMNDQFMFGKSILVAPILEAQYTPETFIKVDEKEGWDKKDSNNSDSNSSVDFKEIKSAKVYLPKGTIWYDYWTNEKHNGGQEITIKTTLDMIPLYIKAGSIIPIGPKVQYATEKKWDNLTLKIYEGADGYFTLYEDEFDNYNYEKGDYTEIPISWENKSHKLTIGKRKGSFAGMIDKRKFTIVLQDGSQKTVDYSGEEITISFK